MQQISFKELINQGKVQKLQDEFCQVTGVVAYCLDEDCNQVTFPSGSSEGLELLQNEGCVNQIESLLERVKDGSLEEQVVEELEDSKGRVAAVAIHVEDMTVVYWVVMEVSEGDGFRFYHILDLLRDTSITLFSQKLSCFSAEVESSKSRYAEQEMSRTLRANETTTRIVQLLDSDERISLVMDKWLKLLAEYLQVDTAQVFEVNQGATAMDVVCEWCKPGVVSYFDKTSQVPTYGFLQTDKPLVISTDNMNVEYQNEIDGIRLKAVMVFPVLKNESGCRTVLSLNYRMRGHSWSITEIKFVADAVKILQSILTRRVQKTSLAGSHAAMEAVLDNVGCSIYVVDKATNKTLFVNRRAQKVFAKELQEGSFMELLQMGVDKSEEGGSSELFHSQRERWYDMIYKEIAWIDGKRATLYSLYDITERKLYQKRIEHQAYTDFLTGLYNRMCCERDLARKIDEAKKTNECGALLYLDLDDFKHINDGLGHQYGDVLLKAISHSLQRIEGIQNTCYRMGGDEFVIVVPPESYGRFEGILDDIKSIFSKPWFLKDADYYCTMSMGIVTYPDGGDSVTDLIKKADIAMYEAKRSGKNRIARYSEGTDSASGKRLDMVKNMRDATKDDYKEFEVYYQPIINVQGEKPVCAGAEALIRWNCEKLGFISPAEFIPLAEYLGLINPIGNFVLGEACRKCKEWNDKGFDYKVNVNLSVVQLLQTDIVEIVEQTLKNTGLAPKNLTLEVTESLAINDMDRMKEILNRIKALGVDLALDDFGTGYSSLNHIREIPIDIIKVDQSFVQGLAQDAYSQSFIKLVSELAENIGVSVCVEGIETEAQCKVLQNMKVKYIQGYYFDKPLPKNEFEKKYLSGSCQNLS